MEIHFALPQHATECYRTRRIRHRAVAVPAFASASTAPLSDARVVAHFNINALQQPENITLLPSGAADVTFTRYYSPGL